MRTHLIIPDVHAHPNYDNKRLRHVGNFIVEHLPDVVMCLGDFADMPSLSSYDRGTKSFEGRRYKKDVKATREALAELFGPIQAHNETRKANKKKQYKPELIMLLGNHENRINRATESSPELDGVISADDLGYKDYGFEVVPFLDKRVVDGVTYSHYFATGVSGRPIGGEYVARQLVLKNLCTSICGHGHTWDSCMRTAADGARINGMSAGCFVHPDYKEDWCKSSRHLWWDGITYLSDVAKGNYNFARIDAKTMEKMYG